MKIRKAEERDIPRLGELLLQVCRVHHQGRPDIFREGGRKYSDGALCDGTTLCLDDLCVDESCRGQGAGKLLYEAVLELARSLGCQNVTLNVWACNPDAMRFYEKRGLKVQKIGMEITL
ncbi:MAG: GNAT family N-acetyltransferase [Oscillospiraceae bacterium]|jgi:GNAT superfamily N-acetyltransferase|nr:GNAT family N-acetyltransferase [Oscillospiraceae bacterium]